MAEKIAKIIKIEEEYFTLDKEKKPIKITNAFRKKDFKVGDGIKYELTNTLKIIDKIDLEYINSQTKNNFSNDKKNFEKKSFKNDTNQEYIDKNRKLNLEEDFYPYNFVSLGNEKDAERKEIEKGNLSGKIKCSLKNLTPLFIGGNKDKEYTLTTEVEEWHKEEYYKRTKYIIPASTIKGELRNIIEVLTNSCMKNVEDKKLSYRLLKRENTFGIIKSFPNGQNDGCIEEVDIIRIERSLAKEIAKNSNKINGNKNAEDFEGFYEIYINKNKVDYYKCNSYPYKRIIDSEEKFNDLKDKIDEIIGYKKKAILWIATEFPRKNQKTYAKILVPNEEIYKFSKSEYEDLKSLIDERNNYKNHLYIDKIDIDNGVIFKGDTIAFQSKNKKAINLAFSEVPRLKYKFSPLDLVPDKFKPCKDKDKLCFACRLFGTIGDNSKKIESENIFEENSNKENLNDSFSIASRIFISDAISCIERDVNKEKLLDRLKSLGEPHPTLLRFYLKYNNYDEKYKENKFEIRGRKFYWHHTNKIVAGKNWEKYKKSIETKNHDNTNSRIYFLEPLQDFEFEINFKDLNKIELGILLYSLELEKGESLHKFGKAKAYGFGSCEIKIEDCLLEDKDKYISFSNSYQSVKKEKIKEYMDNAKKEYHLENDEREEIRDLKYILNRNNILNFSNNKSPFPEEEKNGKINTLNWFMNKKEYNLPTISDYIKEAEKRKGKK